MKKEYATGQLFKNRMEDAVITEEESQGSDQPQLTEAFNNSLEENGTDDFNADSNKASLPLRLLNVLKRVFNS